MTSPMAVPDCERPQRSVRDASSDAPGLAPRRAFWVELSKSGEVAWAILGVYLFRAMARLVSLDLRDVAFGVALAVPLTVGWFMPVMYAQNPALRGRPPWAAACVGSAFGIGCRNLLGIWLAWLALDWMFGA